MPVQIINQDKPFRDPPHVCQNAHTIFIGKVMKEE